MYPAYLLRPRDIEGGMNVVDQTFMLVFSTTNPHYKPAVGQKKNWVPKPSHSPVILIFR